MLESVTRLFCSKQTLKIKDRLVSEFRIIASLTFCQTLRLIGLAKGRPKGNAISPEGASNEPFFLRPLPTNSGWYAGMV